ncbi:NUDIX hydrolase [Microbacterium ureisolvens]|uniref:NUDIX hydrolase n=1 Tax=Microbacterium ureisolvens TaxID=2781186 RepID=A0ABS7HXV6_9MICO|nr:NUDIX hydrolase [Microbacterium ureisolvens]MBW9110078.1 NUDIX hydrolase [Microbacterium ureisolvens]
MPQPSPSADRALQALSDSIGGARSRRPEDATDPAVPVAATVILLRDTAEGLEVLMIERPDRGSFAGAWVFPGGKLEPGDRHAAAELEEAVARRAAVRETAEETGLDLDAEALVTLSCWDPPPGLALRIRTWFFVAPTAGGVVSLSADEAVAAQWLRPADALARHGRGGLTLYPPTWVTLHGLAEHADVESVLGAARLGGVQRFETVARRGGEGPLLLWQGDDEWDPDAAAAASGSRHRLEIGELPWRYQRTV